MLRRLVPRKLRTSRQSSNKDFNVKLTSSLDEARQIVEKDFERRWDLSESFEYVGFEYTG